MRKCKSFVNCIREEEGGKQASPITIPFRHTCSRQTFILSPGGDWQILNRKRHVIDCWFSFLICIYYQNSLANVMYTNIKSFVFIICVVFDNIYCHLITQ